ncbi:TolC family outer membrane protein [Tanticharoenia sakaeratensis]|uniref:Secretion system type I outer membrane protein TolC n=1 Tax=Tanticharoenia sakaeratensis NBRC 103193 TaxID=1231623 RepID=A0A0D6MIX2_9PROT|nr:TolC family outer membrane protein [Tanticharoenia sakaeratensis]GAN53431.1 secretion system type I outer membrane protein TolC [Tanticharoenia sakaeratensis NBRC 103193]GBQ20674.1 secretion system type I outer membrane protein TolC [Tanticharoenia sakaeratensis NBRC 103193]
MTSSAGRIFARYAPAGIGLAAGLCGSTALAQKYDGSGSPTAIPHTLQQALANAYLTNPTLQEERATLRATDEQVPTALAGWRPTIQGSMALSYYQGSTSYGTYGGVVQPPRTYATPGYAGQLSITQPLYSGGHTTAATHQAVNRVMAERARLIATEQQVFSNVVQAYIGVVEDEQLLQLDINNEHVLEQQVAATETRFHAGEITQTDVAQARAALASARATRQQAEGTLQTAQATYLQIVGQAPPPNLIPPQPLALPVKSEQEAVGLAVQNNPNVVNALFTEASQKDAVAVAVSAIMPKISAEAAYTHSINQGYSGYGTDNKYALLNFNIPIYQGGSEYAAVRQARQQAMASHRDVDVQRRAALQLAASNWQQMMAYQAAISSNRVAISANVVALDGVERQAIVGTSTTLAVLQQQETLLQSQIALVQSLSSLVQASYNVAAAIGRLTAVDLQLQVPLYDEKAYYKAVKDRLWGINDYAVGQPGR